MQDTWVRWQCDRSGILLDPAGILLFVSPDPKFWDGIWRVETLGLLDHESGTLMNGISALIRETLLLHSPHHVRTRVENVSSQ